MNGKKGRQNFFFEIAMSNSSKDVHTDDLSRFQLLQRAFEKAVATFLENGCSYSQFSECFEPMSSVYPEDFELLHKQLQQLLDIRLKVLEFSNEKTLLILYYSKNSNY